MQLLPTLMGWTISSALLIAEHVLLWGQPWRLTRPWNYVIGLGTVLFGCFVWALTARGPVSTFEAFWSFACISASGGWIMLAYYIRDRLAQRSEATRNAWRGLRLTQDLIDAGGPDAARQPDVHDRRN
jgi:hypothetical protein